MEFSGERFIPGPDDLLAAEHLHRYRFASLYARGRSVLDIACGSGYGSKLLLEAGAASVTGVDISSEAVAYAGEHYTNNGITFIAADAESFCSGIYELIVSFETVEHLDKRRLFLNNLNKMAAPNGILIISTPNKAITSPMKPPDKIRNRYHKYEYEEDEFSAALCEAGFRNIRKFGQHSYPTVFKIHVISRLLRRWNKDSVETAVVQPMTEYKVPRYFVFVATR